MGLGALAFLAIKGATQLVGGALIGQSLTSKGGPFDVSPRSPKVQPGDILRQAIDIQSLLDRGLAPRLTVDPFTGDSVLSTVDQAPVLFEILEAKFAREQLRPTREELASDLAFRDFIIEQRRRTSRPLSALTQVSPLPVSTRPTARLLGPGVVGRGDTPRPVIPTLISRLSGPCAGPQTGFSRLTCARGGIA